MISRRPWFTVMASKDASQSGSRWRRLDAASLGKIDVRPVSSAGRLSLAIFVFVWIAATLAIWVWGFRSGAFTLAFAIFATVLVAGIVIVTFIRLVVLRMTGVPPPDAQSR